MLYDPERHWIRDAGCRGQPEKMFFGDSPAQPGKKPTIAQRASWEAGKTFCRTQCPVMHQCRRDTLGEEFGVWGGYDQWERHRIRQALHASAGNWPPSRRRAWATVVWGLRHKGHNWIQIQRRIGIPLPLSEELYQEHHARLKVEREAVEARKAQIIDLPLPERVKAPFPDRPSPQDIWVRHDGTVASALYKGETPDGLWIYAQVAIYGRSTHAIKWVKADDVRFNQEMPKLIRDYKERPDARKLAS